MSEDLRGWRVESADSGPTVRPVGTVRQGNASGEWEVEWPDGSRGWYPRTDLILVRPAAGAYRPGLLRRSPGQVLYESLDGSPAWPGAWPHPVPWAALSPTEQQGWNTAAAVAHGAYEDHGGTRLPVDMVIKNSQPKFIIDWPGLEAPDGLYTGVLAKIEDEDA